MSRSAAALLLALALPTTSASAQRGFTLEQVLSAPFPEMLTPAPTGGGEPEGGQTSAHRPAPYGNCHP
jgi:hypothetical protein